MDKTTATAIVISINPDASAIIIDNLLESSYGLDSNLVPAYRPYYVGARTLSLNPPNSNLKKAETLEWFEWENRVKELMATQASLDQVLTDIPPGTEAVVDVFYPVATIIGI